MAVRIAIGGLAIECCSFSPLPTTLEDVTRLRGDDLRAEYPFLPSLAEATFVPLIRGRATPGGPLEPEAYRQIKQEFLDKLRQQKWDGVYLDMHGALYVLGMQDAEGDWIAAVREVVGEACMIAASYDLHGNISPHVIENLDLLTAYRTAPHSDINETRERACHLLVQCLLKGVRPQQVFLPVPLLLPGEKAMTTAEPAGSLYAGIPQIIETYGLLDASILVGYAWVDEPRASASVLTIGEDAEKAQQAADELARDYWSRRQQFRFGMPFGTVDECLQRAKSLTDKPVFISDAGDNITGGGIGDVPYVLSCLLAHEVTNCVYAAIVDATAVQACFDARTGAVAVLSLGGKLDTAHGTPLTVSALVISLDETKSRNRHALIQVDGVTVILTERRTAFTTAEQFYSLGIDPSLYELIVVKLGYLYPGLVPLAKHALLALSPGAIDPAVENLPYEHVQRPIFPLDSAMTWQP